MAKYEDIPDGEPTIGRAATHFYADPSEIRGLQLKLKQQNVRGKTVVKNGMTHLFVNEPPSLDAGAVLGPDWVACTECELCTKHKKVDQHKRLKYVLYPPMILVPTESSIGPREAQRLLSEHPDCSHVAVNAPIKYGDRVRRPQIKPLIGDFGEFLASAQPSREDFARAFWATSVQNGIFQTWAPLYTMFSRGNVTEKKRVLDTFNSQAPIAGTTVIDLYSGIGYFSFPYAKQAPRVLYCWEINPWSVEGMLRAARKNRLNCRAVLNGESYHAQADDQIVIFVEDNQNSLHRIPELDLTCVSHINMGLLPDARAAIPVALALSKASRIKTVIHLHENVASRDFEAWQSEMGRRMDRTCLHLENIKQFSPGVYHVCGDFA